MMKKNKKIILVAVSSLMMLGLAGCGSAQPNTKSSTSQKQSKHTASQTVNKKKTSAIPYQGKENLKKYEEIAKTNSKDEKVQINAGISAYANRDYKKAESYYQKAISLNPKDAVPYNNLGNVYFRGLNQPKDALSYYQKATSIDPKYAYGWINLVLCEQAIGDKAKAKEEAHQGLASVSKKDALYKELTNLSSSIK